MACNSAAHRYLAEEPLYKGVIRHAQQYETDYGEYHYSRDLSHELARQLVEWQIYKYYGSYSVVRVILSVIEQVVPLIGDTVSCVPLIGIFQSSKVRGNISVYVKSAVLEGLDQLLRELISDIALEEVLHIACMSNSHTHEHSNGNSRDGELDDIESECALLLLNGFLHCLCSCYCNDQSCKGNNE